jgi:hypothetical protein
MWKQYRPFSETPCPVARPLGFRIPTVLSRRRFSIFSHSWDGPLRTARLQPERLCAIDTSHTETVGIRRDSLKSSTIPVYKPKSFVTKGPPHSHSNSTTLARKSDIRPHDLTHVTFRQLSKCTYFTMSHLSICSNFIGAKTVDYDFP